MWSFATIDKEEEIRYRVDKPIEELNQKEFKAVAIAREFGEKLSPKRISFKFLSSITTVIATVSILVFLMFRRRAKPQIPQSSFYKPYYYRRY